MKQTKGYISDVYRRSLIIFLITFSAAVSVKSLQAGSATWAANPISSDWNTAANWNPNTVPGPGDTATFDTSVQTLVTVSSGTIVNKIVFTAAADAYTITAPVGGMNIDSDITNNSGKVQNFAVIVDPSGNGTALALERSANAGSLCTFTAAGNFIPQGAGSSVDLLGTASAGSCTYLNMPGSVEGALGGTTGFFTNATAASATITSEGATVSGAGGGVTSFYNQSLAGSSILIATGGSSGGEGGMIQFQAGARGETARVEVFGNGMLDLSQHNSNAFSIGSIEGDGIVKVGSSGLTVGTNNLSTTFSGLIEDDGFTSASFGKTGTGTLTLTGANSYTGTTTVSGGVLNISNRSGSGTGTGAVNVNSGTLSGRDYSWRSHNRHRQRERRVPCAITWEQQQTGDTHNPKPAYL
jgi:autotransporter-associated beta strand protein